jgi:hypothetical protein
MTSFHAAAIALFELSDDELEDAELSFHLRHDRAADDLWAVLRWEAGLRDWIAAGPEDRARLTNPRNCFTAAWTLSTVATLRLDPGWADRGELLDAMVARAQAAGFPEGK